jgi:hypothetical protein
MERDNGIRVDNAISAPVQGLAVQAQVINGGVHVQQTMSPIHVVRPTGADTPHSFGVGSVIEAGEARYVVQDHHLVGEEFSPDGMTVRRHARVAAVNGAGFGWLRQVEDRHADPAAGRSLAAEHELARQFGFPAVLWFAFGRTTTLITLWPRESSGQACDSLHQRLDDVPVSGGRLYRLCIGMTGICDALRQLHAMGRAHRAISPDSVIVRDDAGWELRDLGLAAQAVGPDEHPGDYQAPEQRRRLSTVPGTWTDVYQVAAIFYVALTGRAPKAGNPLPVRAWQADAPADLAAAVDIGLSSDPAQRPDVATFAGLVHQASRHIR